VQLAKNRWELKLTKPLSSITLWVFIFIFSLTLGVAASICVSDWSWFGRSGSLATISGLLLIMRPLLRKGSVQQARTGLLAEITIDENGTQKEYIDPQEIKDGTASLVGAIFTIVGTVIWGFGDILLQLIWPYNI
jgi:hypothetical protein